MKILIAYDGSAAADIAIGSLCRAGLPTEDVEALVVSVAEVWLPPPARNEKLDDTFPLQIPPGLKRAREHAAAILAEGQERAERGQKRVQLVFPGWSVSPEVVNGSPAFELLNRAEEWQPQLIVVGSHGHTAVGKFVLGSVSQKVLTEAPTSVHIGRASSGVGDSAQRIIIGIDGSRGSDMAVRAVAGRKWRPGSEVRVVVAEDLMKAFPVSLLVPRVKQFVDELNAEERSQAEELVTEALKQLRAGLDQSVNLSSVIESGDPKQALVRCAEKFGADCIFTGATGFSNRIERFVLGSVSAAVAGRAHCSVEVVRSPRSDGITD
jgi:nucleotide-binding universal stress UspA family protein